MEIKKRLFKIVLVFTLLFLMLILVNVGCVSGTPPEEEWNKTFGGIYYDDAYSVRQSNDGGYIITGATESYGAGGFDLWIVKTDSIGNEQWNKTFGGMHDDWGNSVWQTTDDGYILAGETYSYGAGDCDFWLVKTDSIGNEQWNKTFGGHGQDCAMSVQQTTDGGYIIAGSTSGAGGYDDFWLVKTDSIGNEQWNKTFGGYALDCAMSVQQTTDGGYIIAGSTFEYGIDDVGDFLVVKTDSIGNEQWSKTYDLSDNEDRAYSIQQTTDGGYIIAGRGSWYCNSLSIFKSLTPHSELKRGTYGRLAHEPDSYSVISSVWLVKTDSNGNEQWNKTFGGANTDKANSVQQTTDGGYIIAGSTGSYSAGLFFDFWLVKTDSNGNEQWNKTFGGYSRDSAMSVRQTTDGGYILAGLTESYGAGSADSWLIKVSGENDDWKKEWTGKDSEEGSTVTTNELQEAIHHWLDDIPVRGHIMSIADLQEIISKWLSG